MGECRPSVEHPWRGWYSPSGSGLAGSAWYRRVDGSEVEVIMVYCPEHGDGRFLRDDRVDVGEVVQYLRSDGRALALLAAGLDRAARMRDAEMRGAPWPWQRC